MVKNSEYTELEKAIAREQALKYAITSLTSGRFNSTITPRNYVRNVREHILESDNIYDQELASQLQESEIDHWEKFYMSVIGKKSPSDLKVAYLSGPNPINDIEVITSFGVLPENVWAFESDNKTYDQAVMTALDLNSLL